MEMVKPLGHGPMGSLLGVFQGHVWAEVPQLPNTQRSSACWLQGIWVLNQGTRRTDKGRQNGEKSCLHLPAGLVQWKVPSGPPWHYPRTQAFCTCIEAHRPIAAQ